MNIKNSRPSVSVVVGTRNRSSHIAMTIKSILANSFPDLTAILIDQSSNSETETATKCFLEDKRFLYIRSNQVGVSRARNLGLAVAESDLVLFTDDDCVVPSDWVRKMVAVFENNPEVAIVFCNVYPAPHDRSTGFIPDYIIEQDLRVCNMGEKCKARGIGAGMGVRKSAAMKIGGFDNELGPGTFFGACEDGDLAVRAILNGFQIFETFQTQVIHYGFRTWVEGKSLTRRNWLGIGAAYAKPLRCGHLSVIKVIAHEAFVVALYQPLSLLIRLKSPRGLKNFFYFWFGFFKGFRASINYKTLCFLDQSSTMDSLDTTLKPADTEY